MLIHGGTVVDHVSERRADVLVRDGRVVAVGPDLQAGEDEVLNATGRYLLPGLVDPHTHFALHVGDRRTADDFASGSAAAAAGGVTTYLNFATQRPGQTFLGAIEAARRQADGHSYVDFGLHLNITRLDPGWEDELVAAVAEGVSSAKVYTTYRGTILYLDDWAIYRLLERSGTAGLLLQVHAENDGMLEARKRELVEQGKTSLAYHGASRPPIAESEAVMRSLFLSRVTGSPVYLVHLSSPLSIDLVTEARVRGVSAIAETCPHFLVLDESLYARPDASRYLMTPPLRSPEFQADLWQRVGRGQVHTVGSDHCGYSLEQRGAAHDFREVSPGIPGVETTLPLLYTYGVCRRRISFPQLVALVAAGPARVFGLWPRKGSLEPGADADLVLFDPRAKGKLTAAELHGAAGFSPYEGLHLEGRVGTVISRGRVIYDRGRVIGDAAWGRYVRCDPFHAGRAAD